MASADTAAAASAVVPAQLGFLAIYNPSLGTTDETIEDQIVYYGGPSTVATAAAAPHSNSDNSSARRRRSSASAAAAPTAHLAPDERNERLRQIGLAQGMVAFGRSFAGDQAVDAIETDKTRVVLHELEPGWWILASVDLTRLPTPSGAVEYSAREVKPAALLLQDLLRAHAVFLLHHDVSLQALFGRVTPRSRVTALLARYWDVFLSSWSVLLHGNPVRDVLPGLRMAACGELGIGVGEEDRGSGEREVLEGLVAQADDLVDLVVCKFGELPAEDGEGETGDVDMGAYGPADEDDGGEEEKWLGTGSGLGAEDGAIFLGVGALSRPALRSLTYWMEDVYSWGQDAYGIADNPSAPSRQTKRRKKALPGMGSISEQQHQTQKPKQQVVIPPPPPLLPPPPVTQLARRTKQPSPTPTSSSPVPTPRASSSQAKKDTPSGETPSSSLSESASSGAMDKYMSFMKLGYGTYWSLGGTANDGSPDSASGSSGTRKSDGDGRAPRSRNAAKSPGRFLIGLVDEADEAKAKKKTGAEEDSKVLEGSDASRKTETPKSTAKAPPRTVFVEMARRNNSRPSSQHTIRDPPGGASDTDDAKGKGKDISTRGHIQGDTDANMLGAEKLRIVVYAQRPFLYAFLFREQKPADGSTVAESDAAGENEKILQILLRRQLSVLHRPLLSSTAYRPDKPGVAGASAMLNATVAASSSSASSPSPSASGSIYDLIWDPGMLTIHSTIPNIPDPYMMAAMAESSLLGGKQGKRGSKKDAAAAKQQPSQKRPPWSRVEALNTHMQILNLYAATRSNGAELERMCKTSRGWWIVWNRIVERSSPGSGRGAAGRPLRSRYGSTLFEEDEEEDNGGDDDDDGADGYQRAPSDCGSDDTATARATAAAALGDYTISKEIILIRKASDHTDHGGSGGGSIGGSISSGISSGLGLGKASSAMRAFSASAYLGFGGGGGSGGGSGGSGGGGGGGSGASAAALRRGSGDAAADGGRGGVGWADGASKLAQGIGVDTKKYVEGLLTLNR